MLGNHSSNNHKEVNSCASMLLGRPQPGYKSCQDRQPADRHHQLSSQHQPAPRHHVPHQLLLRLPGCLRAQLLPAVLQHVQPLPHVLLHVQPLPGDLRARELQASHTPASDLQAHPVCDSFLPVLCVPARELQAGRVCGPLLPVLRVLPAFPPHPGLQTCLL